MSNVVLRNVSITPDKPFAIYPAEKVRVENCTITTPDGVNQFATHRAEIEIVPH